MSVFRFKNYTFYTLIDEKNIGDIEELSSTPLKTLKVGDKIGSLEIKAINHYTKIISIRG